MSGRKTGMAFRRAMAVKHRDALLQILSYGYKPTVGYADGQHIKRPSNSNAQRYWKRHANKMVRRSKDLSSGCRYRKAFDYKWTLY